MKYILLGDNKKLDNSIPDQLHKIDLSKDIIISCPDIDNIHNIDVKFDIDEFLLFNKDDVVFNKEIFTYHPRIKISIPYGIRLNNDTTIPGLSINTRTIKKYLGSQLKCTDIINYENIEFDFKSNTDYLCYYYFTYIFKEYNRNAFLTYLKEINSNGLRIPKNTNLLTFYFTQNLIGGNNVNEINEIYVIYSTYIYNNFPNFGGDK